MNNKFISAKRHGQSHREQFVNGKKKAAYKQTNKAQGNIISSLASYINALHRELEITKKERDFYLSQMQEKDKQINALLEIVSGCKAQGDKIESGIAAVTQQQSTDKKQGNI